LGLPENWNKGTKQREEKKKSSKYPKVPQVKNNSREEGVSKMIMRIAVFILPKKKKKREPTGEKKKHGGCKRSRGCRKSTE